ncbi:MAG: hypothetical protein R3D85_09795 [Paracoccaceae bacterium]
MYGVVLWSSKEEDRAVIWCEDHGDLAFYDGSGESVFDGISLDAGDLVSFTVNEGREMRLATNPRLVAEQQYPGLADRLMSDGSMPRRPAAEAARPAGQGGENVIAFAPRHQAARLAS